MNTTVCFTVDGGSYEVAIEDVEEIAALGALTALPGADPPIAGLCQLHGQILTVVDLAEPGRSAPGRPRMLVVGDGTGMRAALPVATAVVADLPPAGCVAAPRRLIRGTVDRADGERGLLDAGAVLAAAATDGRTAPSPLDVLLVQRGPDLVALPIDAVERVVSAAAADVAEATTHLGPPTSERDRSVVVAAAGRRVALRVDRLWGDRTVQVAALRAGSVTAGTYLGAAIVDADRIALVLDPAGLTAPG